MPQEEQICKPVKLNMDKSKKYLQPDEAFWLLNHDAYNPTALGKGCPQPANKKFCEIVPPEGSTYPIGAYNSVLTNESYSFNWNSNGVHFILIVSADGCELIIPEPGCFPLSADPRHAITQFRVYLDVEKICKNRHGKRLIWTDGLNDIGCIDVGAALETKVDDISFSTPFFDICKEGCAPYQLCVPKPCGCISGEFVPLPSDQVSLSNHLVDVGIKVAFQQIYYDERESDVSDISTLFYQNSKACFDSSEGFPRCLKLKIPLGNPLVDKIKILYSLDNGVTWKVSDIVEKYSSYTSSNQYWYERDISTKLEMADECNFYYYFCNDKQCQSFEANLVNRVHNPIPREAQCLIPIKNSSLGFVNYIQGNCPLSQNEIDKFSVSLNAIDTTTECHVEYANVTVRAIIHNLRDNTNEFIYRLNGTVRDFQGGEDSEDDPSDTAYFGGLERTLSAPLFGPSHDQKFEGAVRNFKPYIEGTDFYGEMEQWRAKPGLTEKRKVGVNAGLSGLGARSDYSRYAFNHYQEYIFKVKKGLKGVIRLQSHHESGNNSDTSTFVVGTINDIRTYDDQALPTLNQRREEIAFDTCSGDVELFETFIIQDNAEESTSGGFEGYITDANNQPCEGLEMYASADEGGVLLSVTDHNGFYHFTIDDPVSVLTGIQIRGELDCGTFSNIQTVSIQAIQGQTVKTDFKLTNTTYANDFYAEVKVTVKDCNGASVGGIPVAVTGSKYGISDALGQATIRIRNYSTRDRIVRAYLMDKSNCLIIDCNDICNPCLPSSLQSTPACYTAKPDVVMPDFNIQTQVGSSTRNGLKKGGKYDFAFVVQGSCGRISAAYQINSITIPRLQEDEYAGFRSFSYNGTGMNLPSWATCLKILRSENTSGYEIQWVVDKIDRTSDGKIKLTFQSLNDYNASYFFRTNTKYQPLAGDRVEFIRNGDGSILTTSANGLLNYQILSSANTSTDNKDDVNFFNELIIDYDDKLSNIKEGAIIEIQRQKECTTEPIYYSICVDILIEVDSDGVGHLSDETGTFTTFDTYLVPRTIGKFYSSIFESKWPSDFWGANADNTANIPNGYFNGLSDIGRAYFVNKFENERRYGRNISINAGSPINYFGDLVKTLDAQEQGDVVAANIVDGRIILVLSENDSSVHPVADDLLRVSQDGTVRALPPDSIIGDAEAKLIGQYGVPYDNVGSVLFGDGFASFVEGKTGKYIRHNYQTAKVAGEIVNQQGQIESQCNSFFEKKAQIKKAFNFTSSDFLQHYRYVTGINKKTGVTMITIKQLVNPSTFNSLHPFQSPNETILYNPVIDEFLTAASFTPDAYSLLETSDANGSAFISFYRGDAYIHPILPDKWDEFYGVACDWFVGVVLNKFPEKIKRPIAGEIQSDTAFYVKEVTTDVPGFLSEVVPKRVQKREDKFNFVFVGNKNSTKGLYGSDVGRGYQISVLFCRDNSLNLAYNTTDVNKQTAYSELDNILFKFTFSEPSAFNIGK